MQVAFIPPKGLEHRMALGDIVMSLAQLTIAHDNRDFAYVQCVQSLGKDRHVIMDNGANEGESFDVGQLLHRAKYIGAHELVLPDVLHDSAATLELVQRSLETQSTLRGKVQYMAVVQGTTVDELHALIRTYATLPQVKVLGLPRLLLKSIGRSVRIDLANWIEETYPGRFALHFLGASSEWIMEPYFAARYAPHVRSIDTSLPYNYGLKGLRLDTCREKVDRVVGYFEKSHAMTPLTTVEDCEAVYKLWCKGQRGML